jgi:RHS repeat-associated protein
VFLGGRLLLSKDASLGNADATRYLHPNQLSTVLATNAGTGSTAEKSTLPFGVWLSSESAGAPPERAFTTYERSDITGLDYAVNRFYETQQGRFIQVDPLGLSAGNLESPQTFNLYAYVGNDPVNRADPAGLTDGECINGRWIVNGKDEGMCTVVKGKREPPPLLPSARTIVGSAATMLDSTAHVVKDVMDKARKTACNMTAEASGSHYAGFGMGGTFQFNLSKGGLVAVEEGVGVGPGMFSAGVRFDGAMKEVTWSNMGEPAEITAFAEAAAGDGLHSVTLGSELSVAPHTGEIRGLGQVCIFGMCNPRGELPTMTNPVEFRLRAGADLKVGQSTSFPIFRAFDFCKEQK